MKIISWNVNGIRAVHKKGFLDWFKKENADIVCIQETKADGEQFPKDLREIDGYNFYFSAGGRKGYSGTAVWSKIKPVAASASIENEKFDNEGRIVRLDFEDFVLFNIYFPNGGSGEERLQYKLDFYDYFIDFVKKIKKNIIICGDYNTAHFPIDLARPKQNEETSGFMPAERKKLDNLADAGFVDTFRYFHKEPDNYTWWDYKTAARERNVGWRIDYFFISKNFTSNLKSASIETAVKGSDHCPISIEIK
ncbi:exodeoxyribonuclease III [Endomicrobium proavitum]|uniref:Exodeoxyribonuclease n=1 Tax=Endomicrobium proavitum TaxID=1408281 RepID=A0A0G3WLA4_9BACT|nr:exodeoxyribonuclease III [Endomicrobium proavitum]AKL98289.1 Exodeoxyribonuclease [Endomicrobium proavitum]